METLITLLSLKNIGLLAFGLGGVLLAGFFVYYVAFALAMITGSIYSAVKICLTGVTDGEAVLTPGLGITMADGGRPLTEEEKTKRE